MLMLLVTVSAYAACRIVPRLLAEVVATTIGVLLVRASRRTRRVLLELARPPGTACWERKSTRAERKALQRGLTATLDMTAFTSLLPHAAIRAHKLAKC